MQIINLIDVAQTACNLLFADEVVSLNEIVTITHELLEDTGLSNVNKRAISRLFSRKDIILKKRDRTVNKNFEAELWASLMICSYDSNAVKLIGYHFISFFVSKFVNQ